MPDGLAKKLRLQGGQRAAFLNAPEGYVRKLDPPDDATVVTRAQGACDFVQVFAASRSELETLASRVPTSSSLGCRPSTGWGVPR